MALFGVSNVGVWFSVGFFGWFFEQCNSWEVSYNCLKRANVRSVEELTALSRFDLMKIRNMGIKTIAEVETKLKDKGLSLRSDYE